MRPRQKITRPSGLNEEVGMNTFQKLKLSTVIRIGYLGAKRLVVFDQSIQPADPELMFIYSVHGHALCVRKREQDESKINCVASYENREIALEQYAIWLDANALEVDRLLKRTHLEVTPLPHIRKKCPNCEGQGTWMDRINKCSYGVTQEEANVIERCQVCRGSCYVEDFL